MELMWGGPVYHSGMEAEDLDRNEDSASSREDADESLLQEPASPTTVVNLRDKFIRPRMHRWLILQSGNKTRRELLDDMFGRCEVLSQATQIHSSERAFTLDFKLMGMSGHFRQVSQADPLSPVWDVSGGGFKRLPNVEAELTLDNEPVVLGVHYAAPKPSTGAAGDSSMAAPCKWVDEARIEERFGAEAIRKLGGMQILLQFLGALCADAGAPGYAEVLPFGLAVSVLRAIEEQEAEAQPLYMPPPRPPLPGSDAEAKKPVFKVTTSSIEPSGPQVPILPQQPTTSRPANARPRGSSQSRRPGTGDKSART